MNDLIAVCRREVVQRRVGLILAAGIGVLPLLLPLLPGLRRWSPSELFAGAATLLGALVALGAALTLGGSIWAAHTASGHLSFYLSRPIRAWAIWTGKLLALMVLLGGIVTLTLGPGLLFGGAHAASWPDFFPAWIAPTGVLGPVWTGIALIALALSAHVARTLSNRRGGLLLMNLAAVGLAACSTAFAFRRLLDAPAPGDLARGGRWLLVAVLTVALAAIASETGLGRLDVVRSRRLASATLGLGFAALALGGWLFAQWTLSAGINDLRDLDVGAVSPDGRWLFIGGRARQRVDYSPGFLYDLENRAAQPLGGVLSGQGKFRVWEEQVVFFDDNTHALWVHISPVGVSGQIVDLTSESAPVELATSAAYTPQAISRSGRFLAMFNRDRISVVDLSLPGQPVVATATLDGEWPAWMRFVGDDRLRVVTRTDGDGGRAHLRELTVAEGKLEVLCSTPPLATGWAPRPSPAGDRMAAVLAFPGGSPSSAETPMTQLALLSTSDCSTLAVFGPPRSDTAGDIRLLADGRLVVSSKGEDPRDRERRTIRLYHEDGSLLREFELPGRQVFRTGGLLDSNHLIVSFDGAGGTLETAVLDLTTGERRALGTGLRPVAGDAVMPGSLATRVFSTESGLVLVDSVTGTRIPLITIAKPRKEPS